MDKSSESDTSLSLLYRLSGSDASESAWSEFVERYRPKIVGWGHRWGLQDADAEDVAQTVLIRLTMAMRAFRYDPCGSFRAWLRTVTQRVWSDFTAQVAGEGRVRATWALFSEQARADLASQVEQSFDQELLDIATAHVRERVAPQTWEAFRRVALDGQSGAEAGREMGMPVAHVFVAKHRVQRMLRDQIRKLDGDGVDEHD